MRKAVILAAGRGTRMGELTDERPKPMIELVGKPMIEHILDRARAVGIVEALIVTGYKAAMIESHLSAYPMGLTFRRQAVVDGTARAAMLGREWVGEDSFLLTYGDCLTEAGDYAAMVETLESHAGTVAVLSAKWVEDPAPGAAVYETEGRVWRIVEKPPVGTSTTNWNSAGAYVFRAEVFEELARVEKSPRGEYELTSAIETLVNAGREVRMHGLRGEWKDVGRPEDVAAAERLVGG